MFIGIFVAQNYKYIRKGVSTSMAQRHIAERTKKSYQSKLNIIKEWFLEKEPSRKELLFEDYTCDRLKPITDANAAIYRLLFCPSDE